MAQLLTLKLTRNDPSNSWGFRLQGGKDFGTPLLIQKVNVGSLAEKAGLQVGDAVIRVNGKEVADVRHKDAQDTIIRAGNLVEIAVQRGGTTTWKPSVTPVGTVPSPNPFNSASPTPVTKTSLTANNRQSPRICAGFNSSSKPFSPQVNGGYVNENGSIKAIVNKQYNTPVGIYSDESIAETLSAQAEVLAGGVLGVNFKKNEKNYNSESSEVFKMVLEAEKEPKSPEPDALQNGTISPPVSGLRHVSAPQPKSPTSPQTSLPPGQNICADCERLIVGVFVRIKDKNLHVECFKCATCGTSLKNVGYYTINNKLYCDIHAKMIARQNPPAPNLEPITIPPSQAGASKIISSALSNSTSAPLSPKPTLAPVPFHPPRQSPTHVSSPVPQNQTFSSLNGANGTKSFSPSNTFSSPISAPKPGYYQSQKAMPFFKEIITKPGLTFTSDSQHVSYYNPSQNRLPFLKPRAEKTSAFMPVMKSTSVNSKTTTETYSSEHSEHEKNKELKLLETVFESYDQKDEDVQNLEMCKRKKMSICSQEVNKVLTENDVIRNSPIPVSTDRPESPVPSESAEEFQHFEQCRMETPKNKILEFVSSRPHSVRSISPFERPATPSQIVVFPPEIPICLKPKVASPLTIYSRPAYKNEYQTKVVSPKPIYSRPQYENDQRESKYQVVEPSSDEERREILYKDENDDICKCIIERTHETLRVTCISPVPNRNKTEINEIEEEDYQVSLKDLPRPTSQPGIIASFLTTAPDRPFTPIEPAKATIFTEPVPLPPETIPYLPTSKEESHRPPDTKRAKSPMVCALTTATDRSYSPLPTTVKFEDLFPEDANEEPREEEKKRPSMASALAIAPKRPYTPLLQCTTEKVTKKDKSLEAPKIENDKPLEEPKIPDLSEDPSFILSRPIVKEAKKPVNDVKNVTKPVYVCSSSFYVTEAAFPPICDELKAKFEKRLRTGSITEKVTQKKLAETTTKQAEESVEEKRTVTSRSLRPFTPSGLHKPINLPHYQQCVKELASRNKTPSLSRRNTPTPSSRAELSRKNTPTSFEATVSTQQKIFNQELTSEARNSLLKTSALSFLTETKDISEKIPPVLGYQPGSIVENLSSYTKVEQCVKTVCEKTLKQIQATSLSTHNFQSKTNEQTIKSNLSPSSSPVTTHNFQSKTSEQTIKSNLSRSSTPVTTHNFQSKTSEHTIKSNLSRSSTPVSIEPSKESHKTNQSQILIHNTSRSSTPTIQHAHITNVAHTVQTQSHTTSRSSTPTTQHDHFTNTAHTSQTLSKSMAASQLSHNLSKTLFALTSKNRSSNINSKNLSTSNTITSSDPNLTGSTVGGGGKGGTSAGFSAPRRGKGVWNPQNPTPGARIPLCAQCSSQIRGPFITALGKIWCPEHFICVNKSCRRSLLDIGFVEEPSGLHCEYCFEKYLAPACGKCTQKIKGDCLNAIGKHFHPECFTCAYCNKLFGNSPFFLEEGLPYCENDWNELFTTKCFACGFPIEAGDRWVEALNNNYHSPCFNCTMCKNNLEGQSFYAKGGRPFCKTHAR